MSFFWTGLGQLYAGRIGRGLIMMVMTPIIWAVAFFGGFLGFLGSFAAVVQTADNPAPPGAGAVGGVGVVLMLSAVAWWVWGMIDAKNLCDSYNKAN